MSNSKVKYYVFVFFCFVCSPVSSYVNSSLSAQKFKCSAQESRTLLLFIDSLFPANNTTNHPPYFGSWSTTTDCCDWNGVTCDKSTGDVIGLFLSHHSLMGSIPKSPINLTHLVYLDLSRNYLKGTIPSWLFNLPFLKDLSLDNNMFSGDVIFNSFNIPSLNKLSLHNNQLGGLINQAHISKFTNLTSLDLSKNNFSTEWDIDTLLSSLKNLKYLDLSHSGLSLITSNATQQVNTYMRYLYLASCKIKEFPVYLRYMINLLILDLSRNEIHGDANFLPQFQYKLNDLYLQSNQIQGPFPPSICNLRYLQVLDLSKNNISGVIPQCLTNVSGLSYLNLNSNQLQQLLPSPICNMSFVYSLILSNNNFGGVIPQCFGNLTSNNLMDLGYNNFHGRIPNYVPSLFLEGLILRGNRLHGEVPTSLSNCSHLIVLDFENNNLNGTFPHWLGGLPQLQILNLKSNMYHGDIGTYSNVESSFPSLRILYLSHNRFVGRLPTKYFQNFNAMKNVVRNSTIPEYLRMYSFGVYYSDILTVKGLELSFDKIPINYVIVDLSNNRFEGDIPSIFGKLSSLIVLNLSHNNLTGQIPHALGDLSEIESLDLSCNRLTGEIPQSLVGITNLAFLNLSENNLTGHIPQGKQFSTFGMNSFQDNPKLCGFPLPNNCTRHSHEPHFEDDGEDEVDNGFTWRVVLMGFGYGTLIGLLMGSFMLSTGRPRWFNVIADIGQHLIDTWRTKRKIHI